MTIPAAGQSPLRIATFNLRGGGSDARWKAFLAATSPDIAFVQETRDPRTFPPSLIQQDGFDYQDVSWSCAAHGKWGSAVLVKRPLELIPIDGLSGSTWWAAGGTVRLGERETFICSLHLAPMRGSYVKSANAFLDTLATRDLRMPIIIGGDWNLTASGRHASDPRPHGPGELTLVERLRTEHGLESAWFARWPDRQLPQTLRFANRPGVPYHCDVVLVPTTHGMRVAHAEILEGELWRAMSDHNPVVVDIEFHQDAKRSEADP